MKTEEKYKVKGYSFIGTKEQWIQKIHNMYYNECCNAIGFNPPCFDSFFKNFKFIKL